MFRIDCYEKLVLSMLLVALAGCGQDMADQPHIEPLETSDFFEDGQSSRPLVPGTVARGHLRTDVGFYEGRVNGQPVTEFPTETVAEQLGIAGTDQERMLGILHRGQERFDIFCAPCHDRTGSGQGMVVLRGFPAPPSFHIDRLRGAPVGLFYDVVARGFGRMPDYASQIPPADRWAIVAYVQALQLSQHATADDLPETDRGQLREGGQSP
jgi:mono/diheme cytochrome c family protein